MKNWPRQKKILLDLVFLFLLLGVSFLFAQKYINFSTVPNEDAAILMRYAKNLGEGHGIVWNLGEKPVDGGTDFLSLVVIAGLYKAGLPLEKAVRSLDYFSHFLTLFLIYSAARKLLKSPPVVGFISAFFFAIGPGLFYTAAYFSTPFFALFACLAWIMALAIMQGKAGHGYSALFAILGLITGLIRPEGVILAGLMLISIIIVLGFRKARLPILWFASVILLLGGTYLLWRWNYFGYPLPNPFYKKGGGQLYFDSLRRSLLYVIFMGIPFWWIYLVGLFTRTQNRYAIACLLPVFGFATAFILLSDETNFAARFQYAVFSIILISWYPLAKDLPIWQKKTSLMKMLVLKKALWLALIVAGTVMFTAIYVLAYANVISNIQQAFIFKGRYDVAMYLHHYESKGYWMATSEAGLLPLYSGWNAVDTWGLNDQWIAHHGVITAEYLNVYHPELIVFHAYFSPQAKDCPDPKPDWSRMTSVLQTYAEENSYTLAGVFGVDSCDTNYYYVRNDFADSAELIEAIRGFDYWIGDQKSQNYAP